MYLYWNDMVYAELTAYGGLNQSALEVLGDQPGPTPDQHPGPHALLAPARSNRTGAIIT